MRLRATQTLIGVLAATLLVSVLAGPAGASSRVGVGARDVSLKVLADSNTAVLVYQAKGRTRVVSACCAINARAPSPNLPQFDFKTNYNAVAKPGYCGEYDGPALMWVVAACKAPDGSYWVAQSWQRDLPNQGAAADAGAGRARIEALALQGAPVFCTVLTPRAGRPDGRGAAYRATVVGPGVLPDLFWTAKRRAYERSADALANEEQRTTFASKGCRPN